jgi:acetyl esterase/lipase
MISNRMRTTTWAPGILLMIGMGTAPAFAQEVVVDTNIVYYDGPEFYAPRHILDVYRLDGAKDLPVLIFIHGGGWTSGNKNIYGYLGNTFARLGLVTVIANYRLTDNSPGRVVHPGHIEDVARAFAWTYATIADYGGNPEKIFVSGHSAGGHLVSLLAVDPRYLGAHDLSLENIAGVISLSGVYDVRGIPAIFGDDPEQRRDASPIFHVGDWPPPPFQVLYGENNLPGLGPQAVMFYEALAGLPSEADLIEFPGRTHGTMISRIGTPGDEVTETMMCFLINH